MGVEDGIRGFAGRQDGLVTRAQARRAGLSRHDVDNLVSSGRWRLVARAVYLTDARDRGAVSRRCRVRAAVLSLGPHARLVFDTAAELHGIAGLPRSDEIHVGLPGRHARIARVSDPAIVLHQLEHPPGSVLSVAGIPATVPLRTVADVILRVPRFPAVCVLDSALNQRLITDDDLGAVGALLRGRRGAVAARRYLAQADGRAQSPLETRARLRCVDGRVPPDVLQLAVRDVDGYLLGIGDLGWRRARVIAEADGRGPHDTPRAIFADRQRQNRLVGAGYTVLRFTWSDTLSPDYIPHTVRAAIAAARLR
ncbi:type IV toxin-antitoxin system AbiEi family antitoxin domain-containing protein [Micromonospora fluostatini]|uniref:type IV toxin-antitoxin system AbiEi family antitoxin domain-containing protein n=1 Tax=Micromonospora sp. JCM 30529 TaxID=3421643 RepID=UPI003D175858